LQGVEDEQVAEGREQADGEDFTAVGTPQGGDGSLGRKAVGSRSRDSPMEPAPK